MNKILLPAALAVALTAAAFAPTAQAANSGTINISGKVINDTCTISVNGGSSTSSVTLPVVATGALNVAGATAGDTNFDIKLTGCDSNVTSARMAFAGGNIDPNGNLNTSGAGQATNLQVRLLSGALVINASSQANAPAIAVASGTGTTTLTAQYYANGAAVGAGLVNTSVNFTLTYL
ncbi:MAG: fimbrial protein [Rhodanobacter sp.]